MTVFCFHCYRVLSKKRFETLNKKFQKFKITKKETIFSNYTQRKKDHSCDDANVITSSQNETKICI